jgi:hypothetical protein
VSIAIARGYLRIWGHSPSAQLSRQPPPLTAQPPAALTDLRSDLRGTDPLHSQRRTLNLR